VCTTMAERAVCVLCALETSRWPRTVLCKRQAEVAPHTESSGEGPIRSSAFRDAILRACGERVGAGASHAGLVRRQADRRLSLSQARMWPDQKPSGVEPWKKQPEPMYALRGPCLAFTMGVSPLFQGMFALLDSPVGLRQPRWSTPT
jgi:hypothetical protein